jgi:hypothetical protein
MGDLEKIIAIVPRFAGEDEDESKRYIFRLSSHTAWEAPSPFITLSHMLLVQLVQLLSHCIHSVICVTDLRSCVAVPPTMQTVVTGAEAQPPATVRGSKRCIIWVEPYEKVRIRVPGFIHGYFKVAGTLYLWGLGDQSFSLNI